jgi:EAL domain-containing protein (putative c-di-GMP-specific phosphodiesterase class I)
MEVAVNLSPVCLQDSGLPDQIEALLAANGLSPGNLVLEVTESHAVSDPKVIELLTRLRMRGIGLSIDDFGTGHSTLLSLLRMPFSELKIDRSFVLALGVDPEAEKIVRTTIAMARELGLRSVAEGVETEAVADVLGGMGCDVGQGWLYGKPTVVSELLRFVGADRHGR